MAIETIPKIIATSAGGGMVYAIDFQRNFASEPSRVTYSVVNSSGSYSLPTIESDASISFGGFNFNGYVYSYELNESVSGNTLSITLIDKSVILDKLYVCVFRRGLMGFQGSKQTKQVGVKFNSDDEFYSITQDSDGFFKPQKNNYRDGFVSRSYYGGSTKRGDIIIVGEEEVPDTNCEIPSSSYTFNQLKSAVGGSVSGFSSCPINDDKVKQTYEGTLRSVLNSWCQDFGYSFYWDYSSNSLKFFDAKRGVFSLPNVSDKKITSKKAFSSAEGKYNQIGVDYFAKPYNPKTATASLSKTFYGTNSLYCYPVSYFVDRSMTESESSIYGSGRTKREFIISCALGYVSPALRKIYNYSLLSDRGSAVGIKEENPISASTLAVAMKAAGFSEIIADLVSYSGYLEGSLGSGYEAILCNYDEGSEEAWTNTEQEIFTSKIGNFYRCSYNKSGESIFCTSKMIIKTSVSYEPEGVIMEDNDSMEDSRIVGRRVFSRGAPGPETSGSQALERLGLADSGAVGLQKLLPIQIEILKDSSLFAELENAGIGAGNSDTLLIIPKKSLISSKLGFTATYTTGQNQKETTWSDVENSQQNSQECTLSDPNENKCLSQKEELKQKQRKQLEDQQNFETKKPFSGLNSKGGCVGANIKTNSGSVKIISSSDSNYRSVITYSYSVEAIIDTSEAQQIVSNTSGSTSSSAKIIETRLIVDNRTTSDNLSKQNLTPQEIATRSGYIQSNDLSKVTYTCAGFVSSLPTSVTSGLESLDMSISDAGFSASYTYSTRPPVFGKQDLSRANVESNSSSPAFQVR